MCERFSDGLLICHSSISKKPDQASRDYGICVIKN